MIFYPEGCKLTHTIRHVEFGYLRHPSQGSSSDVSLDNATATFLLDHGKPQTLAFQKSTQINSPSPHLPTSPFWETSPCNPRYSGRSRLAFVPVRLIMGYVSLPASSFKDPHTAWNGVPIPKPTVTLSDTADASPAHTPPTLRSLLISDLSLSTSFDTNEGDKALLNTRK